jgi:hypothetical protein
MLILSDPDVNETPLKPRIIYLIISDRTNAWIIQTISPREHSDLISVGLLRSLYSHEYTAYADIIAQRNFAFE